MQKVNNKVTLVMRWMIPILWMAFIFYMSSMPGTESTEQSDFLVNLIGMLGVNINGNVGETISFIVRKAAHITEYVILAILIYRVVILYIDRKKAKLLMILIVILYASTDEFHQLFVPGREGTFRDVLIDTSGAIIAIIFINLYERFKYKKKN